MGGHLAGTRPVRHGHETNAAVPRPSSTQVQLGSDDRAADHAASIAHDAEIARRHGLRL